jgi:hypothetical protein
MFGKRYMHALINRSAENPAERRQFLKSASAAGLGLVGAGMLSAAASPALAVSTNVHHCPAQGTVHGCVQRHRPSAP